MQVLNKLVQNSTVDETIHRLCPMEILKSVFQQVFLNKNSYNPFKISLGFLKLFLLIHFNVFFM